MRVYIIRQGLGARSFFEQLAKSYVDANFCLNAVVI